ncbi:MAG: SRPBCC family protein [Sandaracinus sp.]|nr:SRPBCC family protein [Sandaracinus sp.]MCB9612367.1 SRPBCC family protein [Sandaracinus sp.]MCB9624222.1 SRPBCC family protein [Sandaracinus sp.]
MASTRALASALIVALSATAQAQREPPPADDAPLAGLTRADLEALAPELDRGPVLHAIFRPDNREIPEIAFATRVNAPAARVAEIVASPQHYPEFMPALDEIAVESRQGTQIAYRWKWQIALFTLTGRNTMTVFPGNPTRGYRVEVRSTGGDMGRGRISFRITPDGPERCTLVVAMRLDMRDANYLAEQLSSGGITVQRSINVVMASVMALGTKTRAETERPVAHPLPELARPAFEPARLRSLLERGDLVFLELDGDRLARVSVAGRMGTGLERTRAVMNDPEEFGRSLVFGSTARIVERDEASVVFEWGIPMPLVGIEGRMRLRPGSGEVAVDGVSGSLRSGQWRFDTHVEPTGEAVVFGWARFDPGEASRLVRRLIADDTSFSHGLAVATQVMIVRSLRQRALGYAPG